MTSLRLFCSPHSRPSSDCYGVANVHVAPPPWDFLVLSYQKDEWRKIFLKLYSKDWLDRKHLLHHGHHGGALPDRLPPVLQVVPRVARQVLHHPHLHLLIRLQHSQSKFKMYMLWERNFSYRMCVFDSERFVISILSYLSMSLFQSSSSSRRTTRLTTATARRPAITAPSFRTLSTTRYTTTTPTARLSSTTTESCRLNWDSIRLIIRLVFLKTILPRERQPGFNHFRRVVDKMAEFV